MRKISRWTRIKQWLCWNHDYTSPIKERGGRLDAQLVIQLGTFKAFVSDSRMYCKKCGYVPQITLDAMKRGEDIDKMNIDNKEKLAIYLIGEISKPTQL